jgi:hypothetical protein
MHIPRGSEFQKYNTIVRFIGFQPIQACIIDQHSNLDASSIYGLPIRAFSREKQLNASGFE